MLFLLAVFIFILGLCIGSFLNVVILRLETSQSLGGRSHCPHCKHGLSWFDLIPVFSFLFLGGKCRYCKAKISIQYPLVEIATATLFLLIFTVNSQSALVLCFMLYVSCSMIVIFIYDLKHFIIPDKILFPAIIVALLFQILNFKFQIPAPIINYLLAALLASAFFLAIYLISQGRGLGFGDVKLAILMGLLLGFPNILVALLLAFWLGAIVGLSAMALHKKGLKSELPFAPFLIAGTFIALFWGQPIINWYTSFFLF